jgi:hypothetical protein
MFKLALIAATILLLLYIIGCIKDHFVHLRLIAPGKELQAKFKSLGDVKGKTKDEIHSTIGPPFTVSIVSGTALTFHRWTAGTAYLMLDFDDEICTGAHEYYAWLARKS